MCVHFSAKRENDGLIYPLKIEDPTATVSRITFTRAKTTAVSRVAEIGTNYQEKEKFDDLVSPLRSHQHVKPLVTWMYERERRLSGLFRRGHS